MHARAQIISILFCLGSLVLVGHLFDHQILDQSYRDQAQSRTLIKRTIDAPRGLIYDRHGEHLVVNEPTYELEMIHRDIPEDMDTLAFCKLLGMDVDEYVSLMKLAMSKSYYRSYIPITFLSHLESEEMARLQEHLFRFKGFYPRLKNKRGYPSPCAAHVLGYISEVDAREIERSEGKYTLGDVKGASGIELRYEDWLRGTNGTQYLLKDNVGREVDDFNDGLLNNAVHRGQDIQSTLDLQLQQYGEQLMAGKRGGIVALEPSTGEILAMISVPTYDPNRLSLGKERTNTFLEMYMDTTNRPLLDRSLMSKYPPGSIFKPILSLIALQDSIWVADRSMTCTGEFDVNKKKGFVQKCRNHPRPKNVSTALQWSCNSYYYQMLWDYVEKYGFSQPGKGLDELMDHLSKFGLGRQLGVDLQQENTGFLPSAAFYDAKHNTRDYRWSASYILSIGIGQGELELTTVQMANLAAILANRGHYYVPHIVRSLGQDNNIGLKYQQRQSVGIDAEHFQPVLDGMELVVSAGTARRAQIPGVAVCGKTGTSQNAGKDHSVFFGFAPKDNPQIAIAVFVENAGGGSAVAAPIGGLMMERYLHDSISPRRQYMEDYVRDINLYGVP